MSERCRRCSRTKYEHIDHAHADLTTLHGKCPFGDCGAFEPVTPHDGGA